MACPITRKYPKKQPPSWKPPVPRWQLVFPEGITHVYTLYIGIQSHSPTPNETLTTATHHLIELINSTNPDTSDSFLTEEDLAHDIPNSRVWVLYFLSQSTFDAALNTLSPLPIVKRFGKSIGIWIEHISTPLERLETNYAGLHERPGLANLPGTKRERHELSAYWGAARDRIPASAEDLFAVPGTKLPEAAHIQTETSGHDKQKDDVDGAMNGMNGHTNQDPDPENDPSLKTTKPATKTTTAKTTYHITDSLITSPTTSPLVAYPTPSNTPRGLNQRLNGTSYDNITHIRSGQCWNQCPPDEAAAYERPGGLQEKLMKGMTYLWTNAHDTGTLGLRWLRNVDPTATVDANTTPPKTIKESSGAGFFRNLKDLENWSSTHPSHMAIFTGAHKHARKWGPDRKFMTWHEVSVLKRGEAEWEYVNCKGGTGVAGMVGMEVIEDLSWD